MVNKIIIQHELVSGVMVDITPLSPYTRAEITEKAKELYPDPDPEPFQKSETNILGEDVKYIDPAKEVDWKRAQLDVRETRLQWAYDEMSRLSVSCNGTKDEVVKAYQDDIKQLRSAGLNIHKDDWEAVLFHCLLTWNSDRNMIIKAIMQTAPLTDAEVVGAFKFFRIKVSE
jgi:hypothetical protein